MTNEKNHPVDLEKLMECLENGNSMGEGVTLNEEEKRLLKMFAGFREHLGKEEIPFDKLAMLARLNSRIEADEMEHEAVKESVVKRMHYRRLLYIAAVLIPLIIAGVWFFDKNNKQPQENAITERVLQDVKLTLSDGSIVNLGDNKEIKEKDGEAIAQSNSGVLTYDNDNHAGNAMNTLQVPRGRKFSLMLVDGSKVWLNAESSISFPVAFNGNTREVKLVGEAYFEVKHDASKPFIVHAANANVQVLGTSFDVAAYGNETMKTTLVHGSVKVSNPGGASLMLVPNEQAVQSAVDNSLRKSVVDVEPFVAWKENVLVFQNERLENIAKRLEREYDYQFAFNSEAVKNIHYTVSLTQAPDIATVLNYLSKTGPFRYTIKGKEIIVREE